MEAYVNEEGHVILPEAVRKEFKLEPGTEVSWARSDDGQLKIATKARITFKVERDPTTGLPVIVHLRDGVELTEAVDFREAVREGREERIHEIVERIVDRGTPSGE